jgi:hypothetical protein
VIENNPVRPAARTPELPDQTGSLQPHDTVVFNIREIELAARAARRALGKFASISHPLDTLNRIEKLPGTHRLEQDKRKEDAGADFHDSMHARKQALRWETRTEN